MSRGPFAPFLQYIRSRRRAADDDADLLARFAADRDEDAFAELVRRYGPLVWGVARQVLGHDQDAEDAFQATFLLLSRNAARIRTAAAVAGWLHGTAWRVATKARARAVTRRQREQSVPPRPNDDPAAEVALHELQATLHAEVAALPAKYRTPFVLCVLEGRGRSQVARSLGWNEGTLSTRLAWARQRLRSRLLRRGVDLAAALAAVEVTRDAVPAALANAAMTAVRTAIVSATVTALVQGGVMTTKLAQFAAIGLVLGVIAVGTAGLMGSDPPVQPPTKEKPAPQPAAAAPDGRPSGNCTVSVAGAVTGPDDKPLAGATVFLRMMNRNDKLIAPAKTDAQGHFEFKNVAAPMAASILVRSPTDREGVRKLMYQICAIADGMAVEWAPEVQAPIVSENAGQGGEPRYSAGSSVVNVKLAPSAHFQGKIVDDQGRPVVGAKVHMTACDHLSLPPMPLELTVNLGRYRQTGYLPEERTTATSGADGRFRIDGVPADAIAGFSVKHSDFATLTAVASLVDPNTVPRGAHISTIIPRNANGLGGKIIVGDIDLTLVSPRVVAVEVVSSTTGKPVANARVSISPRSAGRGRGIAAQRPPDQPTSHAGATTDAAGKVTLKMPPGNYTLLAFSPDRMAANPPAPNSTYYGRQETPITIKDDVGQSQTIRLDPACKINLEIVDAATGKPIVNQQLLVEMEHGVIPGLRRGVPIPPPPPLPGLPALPRPQGAPVVDWRRVDGDPIPTPRTDADGKATTWSNPGKGRLRVNLNRLSDYEDFETAEPVTLDPAGEVKLRVEMRKKAQPVVPSAAPPAAPALPTVPITIGGIATGPNGKPVSGAVIYLSSLGRLNDRDAPVVATTSTDANGEYEFRQTPVPVRASYVNGDKPPILSLQLCGSATGLALACKRIDWPTGNRNPTVSIPRGDLVFRRPVEYTGQIVDISGRPLAGVTIKLITDGENSTENLPDSVIATKTDANGRFRLKNMPDDVVTLEFVDPAFPKARTTLSAATEKTVDAIAARDHESDKWARRIFVGDIKLTLDRPRSVPVHVVANLTGEPVKNVLTALSKNDRIWIASVGATDADGRVLLQVPPGEYAIQMLMPPDMKYLPPTYNVTVNPTPAEQPLTIRLMVGGTVELEAIDADTRQPVRHVQFEYANAADPKTWSKFGEKIRAQSRTRNAPDRYPDTDKFGKVSAILPPGKWVFRTVKPFDAVDEPTPVDVADGDTAKLRILVREKE